MAKNIDYSKNVNQKQNQQLNKSQLLRKLNISRKDRMELEGKLNDTSAVYDQKTVETANKLLGVLANEGVDYKLIARNNGGGLLAQTRGLGGNNLVITIAAKYEKDRNNKLQDRNDYIGNISVTGRNYNLYNKSAVLASVTYYVKNNNIEKGSQEYKKMWAKYFNDPRVKDFDENNYKYLLKAMMGDLNIEVNNKVRSDVQYQSTFKILDERNRPVALAYGRDMNKEVPKDYIEMSEQKGENRSPLMLLVEDTNQYIREHIREDNTMTINNNGFEEEVEVEEINITNQDTLEGLNLDTLLLFNPDNRNLISQVVNYELKHNPNFTLNDHIIAEQGLKDILSEQSAGTRATQVNINDLELSPNQKQRYEQLLQTTANQLNKHGIDVQDVHFDSDYVLHWSGVNRADKETRSGEIGQIFLPDDRGVLKTGFNTLKDSEDRNYAMVTGYTAYYKDSQKKTTTVPKTIKVQDSLGNERDIVATVDKETGNLVPFKNNKGKFLRPERFPEEELLNMNAKIQAYNQTQDPSSQLPEIATEERSTTLRDRLRLKGYEQLLNQQLKSVLAKQVIQEQGHAINNVSLNKLYHGDTYGMRVKEHTLQNDNAIRTLNKRVKFDNEVLQLTANDLDQSFDGEDKEYDGEDYSHRFNIKELDGMFDRSVSTDGQNLGLIRYLTKQAKVLDTGEIVTSSHSDIDRANIIDDIPFSFGDPGDRSMMASNQAIKARNISPQRVALMTYKGYTFEDGSVVSERFAYEQGEVVNGLDEEGYPIPLQVGDKISDLHGNKSTISYIAKPEDDVFKENPELDVIMNPFSVSSRKNTGLLLEMKHDNDMQPVMHNDKQVGESGMLNVVITDITARQKTQTYQDEYDKDGNLIKKSSRKGRSFGVQEAWVANALKLDHTMNEIYGQNIGTFEKFKSYLNVTGLDFDENAVLIESNGYNNGKSEPKNGEKVENKVPVSLPENGGYIELPTEVTLASGMKTKYIHVLPEKFRTTQELFAGERMYHDYSNIYAAIIKEASKPKELEDKFKVKLQDEFENIKTQDLTTYDLTQESEQNRLLKQLTNQKDIDEFNQYVKTFTTEKYKLDQSLEQNVQKHVNQLNEAIINDHLGGRSNLIEYTDEHGQVHLSRSKQSDAIKRSMIKRDIMSKQVPNSVTSVVTAEPNVDINTIKVSSDIYNSLDLKNENDSVLLWRDPALHDGSMRSFKVEIDENVVGVGINPLVTESFGMDFDGDTVGVYAPKTKEAQEELVNKASIEQNLIDPTSKEFCGNVSMDIVSGAVANNHVITNDNKDMVQGPLADKVNDPEYEGLNPKEQITKVLTEISKEPNGWEKVNQFWKDTVTVDANIGSSAVQFDSRETTRKSLEKIASIGAKGKLKDLENPEITENINHKEQELGRKMTYLERMNEPEKYLSEQSTILDYYDRAEEMLQYQSQAIRGDKTAVKNYERLYKPYVDIKQKDGTIETERNLGSLGYDQDKTRMAQSGKTDLTGLAGAKSQTLVSLMYDKEGGAMSAMEVTEPLTQATLKLKHDPKQTPEIKNLFKDYDEILNKGGYTEKDFIENFKEMYDKVGLDVRDEHLKDVFDALSKDDDGIKKTEPIQEVIEEKMQPLMKSNIYGYDALKEAATGSHKTVIMDKGVRVDKVKDVEDNWVDYDDKVITNSNTDKLKLIALGKDDMPQIKNLKQLSDGYMSEKHVPDNLNKITMTSRIEIAEQFAAENGNKETTKNNEIDKDNKDVKQKTSGVTNEKKSEPNAPEFALE